MQEPTEMQINRAAWKWCSNKERETDSSDILYFIRNWRYLPGLKACVEREVAEDRLIREARLNY